MTLPTLLRQGNPLADPAEQLRVLAKAGVPPFERTLAPRKCHPVPSAVTSFHRVGK